MKTKSLAAVVLAISFSTLNARAEVAPQDPFWSDLQELVVLCAEQPIERTPEGKEIALPLRSTCKQLIVTRDALNAHFVLEGEAFQANLVESEYSDGGDLYHLTIINNAGEEIATRTNFPAFGDILLALAGTHEGFRRVPVGSR